MSNAVISVIRFRRRRFVLTITTFGHGGHVGHATSAVSINFCPMSYEYSICNLTSVCPVASGQKLFEIYEIGVTLVQ